MTEPRAYLYEHGDGRLEFEFARWPQVPEGWTETPLYGPEALAEWDGRIAELEAEARRFAEFYPVGSDGRNTFIIFADKIKALKGRTDD